MKKYISIFLAMAVLTACDDFLNLKPESSLSPAQYLTTEDNIASYATDMYNILPVHGETSWGISKGDAATDNMAYSDPSDAFAPGYWRVGQTGGSWSFTEIYRCNYFFDNVLTPKRSHLFLRKVAIICFRSHPICLNKIFKHNTRLRKCD